LCVENFGQVNKMNRKMYSKLLYILVNNFFILRNYESGPVPLSSARRDESNGTLFVRFRQTLGPPSVRNSEKMFEVGINSWLAR